LQSSARALFVVKQIACALNVPVSFFYAEDDDEALLIRWFCKLSTDERAEVM